MTESQNAPLDVSFEVFPAKNDLARAGLKRCVDMLARLNPRFFSVTYGANGSDRLRTAHAINDLRKVRATLPFAGHLTCAGGTREQTLDVAREYEAAGAKWIVALRGDGDAGAGGAFVSTLGGFLSAPELIASLREKTRLRIAVAGYPEPHPDSRGLGADIEHLKRKVDAGADTIVTQFFFDNDDFYRYIDRVRAAGIDAPVVPGIMPIRNFDKMRAFAKKCGASIPARLATRFEKAEARGMAKELALAVCAGQCDELREQGVRAFHFYTLNDPTLTLGTCQALGLDPVNPVDGGESTTAKVEIDQARRA